MKEIGDWLRREIEQISDPTYLSTLDRGRPYNGQPHTDAGERGKQEISGITMRDLQDCFIRACFHGSGLRSDEYPRTIYELPWDDIDPMAIAQNLGCEVERYMGIFPNVPKLECQNEEALDEQDR